MSITSGSGTHVQSLPRALAPAFNRCSTLTYLYSWWLSAAVFSPLDGAATRLFFSSCCDYEQLRQKKNKKAEGFHLPICVSDEIKVGGGWGGCWGFFLLSRGKMDFYSCFVAQQTSSLKVRDSSAADSPRYLLRRPLAARSERGGQEKKSPSERQQWPLWRHALLFKKEGKASDVPHTGFYGYNLR